jgi:hypothetical protein
LIAAAFYQREAIFRLAALTHFWRTSVGKLLRSPWRGWRSMAQQTAVCRATANVGGLHRAALENLRI